MGDATRFGIVECLNGSLERAPTSYAIAGSTVASNVILYATPK